MNRMNNIPSIARRLSTTLWIWFLVFSVAVGLAVWLQTDNEVHELFDDSLIAASDVIQANLPSAGTITAPNSRPMIPPGTDTPQQRFAWQWVSAQGELKARSPGAPNTPWRASEQLGFFNTKEWRVYGLRVAQAEGSLYVAQSQAERHDASVEVALGAVLAVLAVGIVGKLWLKQRISAELAPIRHLSERMLRWSASAEKTEQRPWGPPERQELQPVHDALDALSTGLEAQIAQERAFSAHTSHALRTPLAGIDTQLAVALRETEETQTSLRERLQKIRHSAQRMQRVVESLLSLFRHGGEAQRDQIDLETLIAGMVVPSSLTVRVLNTQTLMADADLLSAALFNLLDNSARYGARSVELSMPHADTLQIKDDGPGVNAERLQALQLGLSTLGIGASEALGMGLWLAQRVALAHRGSLKLESQEGSGLTVTLQLNSPV